jgi:hypothetical protein
MTDTPGSQTAFQSDSYVPNYDFIPLPSYFLHSLLLSHTSTWSIKETFNFCHYLRTHSKAVSLFLNTTVRKS